MSEPVRPSDNDVRARFMLLAVNRLFGAAMVVIGIMGVRGYIGAADWFSYALIAVGAVEFFVVPQMLARAWRTPKPPIEKANEQATEKAAEADDKPR